MVVGGDGAVGGDDKSSGVRHFRKFAGEGREREGRCAEGTVLTTRGRRNIDEVLVTKPHFLRMVPHAKWLRHCSQDDTVILRLVKDLHTSEL